MKEKKKFFRPHLYPIEIKRIENSNARWFVSWTEPTIDGREKNCRKWVKRRPTYQERLLLAEKIINQVLQKGEQFERRERLVSVHPMIQFIQDNATRWKQRTFITYLSKAKDYVQWLEKSKNSEIDPVTGHKYLNHLLTVKKLSPTSVNGARRCISVLYDAMKKLRLCNFNPFSSTSKIPEQTQTRLYFTREQIQALKNTIAPADPQLWMACSLTYYCFIRPRELRYLRVEHIQFSESKILIPGEISKNKKSQFVRIPNVLMPLIEHLKKYPLDHFIISPYGYPSLRNCSENWLYEKFKIKMAAAKIRGDRYSFYSWKNTGIYHFIKSGGSLKQLQLQLRHHSLDQVNQYATDFGLLDCNDIEDRFPAI